MSLKTKIRWGLMFATLAFVSSVALAYYAWREFKLNDWRVPVQRELSRAIGQEVEVGRVELAWRGLAPKLTLSQLRLFEPDGKQVALEAEKVRAGLALRSLWQRKPRFRQLDVEGLKFSVEKLSANRLRVLGREFGLESEGESPALAWLMDQPTISLKGVQVRLLEKQGVGTHTLEVTSLDIRNQSRRHQLKLGALKLSGAHQALLQAPEVVVDFESERGKAKANAKNWQGELYAKLTQLRVEQALHVAAAWGLNLPFRAKAELDGQAWLTFAQGRARDGQVKFEAKHAGFDLPGAQRSGTRPMAVEFQQARAHVGAVFADDGSIKLDIYQANLLDKKNNQVAVTDEVHQLRIGPKGEWLGGKLALQKFEAASLLQSLTNLPLPTALVERLRQWDVRGQVESLRFEWSTQATNQLPQYSVGAKFERFGFSLRDQADPGRSTTTLRVPAFANVSGEASITEKGGVLKLDSRQASLTFPGLFEEPTIPVDWIKGQTQWRLQYDPGNTQVTGVKIEVGETQFANADAQGAISGVYETGGKGAGLVNLSGNLSRAQGPRTVRYLPTKIPASVREWVAKSVSGGESNDLQFRLRGDLADFPFRDAASGEFLIQAKVRKADLNYAPGWPSIKDFDGELKFQNVGMDIRMDSGTMFGVKLEQARARILDFAKPDLLIEGKASGPAQDMIRFVNESPILTRVDDFTRNITIQGNAKLDLQLSIPIQRLDDFSAQGHVDFAGNTLKLDIPLPVFEDLSGRMSFDEKTLQFPKLSARFLKEAWTVTGATTARGEVNVNASGRLAATSIQDLLDHPVTRALEGAADFNVEVKVKEGQPSVVVSSQLEGMSSKLPEPFNKASSQKMPLQVQSQPVSNPLFQAGGYFSDRVTIRLGQTLGLDLERLRTRVEDPMQITRAALLFDGDKSPPARLAMPMRGFEAQLSSKQLNLDQWTELLAQKQAQARNTPQANTSDPMHVMRGQVSGGFDWTPRAVSLSAADVRIGGRNLHQVKVNATRTSNDLWRFDLQSKEASGQVQWWPAKQPQRIEARLSKVEIPRDRIPEVDQLISPPDTSKEAANTAQLPDLDIQIEALRFGSVDLGRMSLLAAQQSGAQPIWRIQKLDLETNAASINIKGAAYAKSTQLDLQADIRDCAAWLASFGQYDLVRDCKARLQGQLGWDGSPFSLSTKSLQGQVRLDAGKGQFIKMKAGLGSSLGKLLGVFNLQSLPRRLNLDFSDVFAEGLEFESIAGSARIDQGIARIDDVLIKSPSATVNMSGQVSLVDEKQDLLVKVQPKVDAGVASLAYAVIVNPVVGLGSLVGQIALRGPIEKMLSFEMQVQGSWDEPVVRRLDSRATDRITP